MGAPSGAGMQRLGYGNLELEKEGRCSLRGGKEGLGYVKGLNCLYIFKFFRKTDYAKSGQIEVYNLMRLHSKYTV